MIHYKAQLVAQGFSQVLGIDFFDTYTPVVKLPSVCTILALVNRHNLKLHQVDIKKAYINSNLMPAEVIFVHHPLRYTPTNTTSRVLQLQHMIYKLKQSGHC